jgi:cytochrome c biogenesis protein CcdA/thiol-disulfide isomerase/thioredoxin
VLPVIFLSGGAQSARTTAGVGTDSSSEAGTGAVSRWRPYAVIAGLVVAFSFFTLLGSLLLSFLMLPQDTLRWAGIVVLFLIGLGLMIPAVQQLLEKPFSWIPQRQVSTERGGFLLGLALGAVYVPCAGPVLAAITVAGSTGRVGPETIVLVVTFAIGTAIPLLIFALAGRGVAERVTAFRTHQRGIRITGGVVMIALAIGLVFNVPAQLQTLVPDYTASLQEQFVGTEEVAEQLELGGIINEQNENLDKCTNGAEVLQSCGTAPDILTIEKWYNTADGQPIDLEELRGQVVLIDFWAYSCINCQRALPKLTSWDRAYRDAGLTVIGVHSPEYAFEKVPSNVEAGIERYRIDYPVALDNSLSTWTNYRNWYWPAQYLIDAEGVVRHVQFGEGKYATTEALFRELLVAANPSVRLPLPTGNIDRTPVFGSTTPESYLGLSKVVNFGGAEEYGSGPGQFDYPSQLGDDQFAFDGDWTLDFQNVTPTTAAARIKLNYTASEVRIVLSGEGTMTLTVNGTSEEISVGGAPTSYRLIKTDTIEKGTLEVTLDPTIQAYSFTFG